MIVIDKPQGWTSFQVVAYVRRMLSVKKAGHGGTLDPLATGVLPIYLNEGTKLVPFNINGEKEYIATIRLGQETDTLDGAGRVIAERADLIIKQEEVEQVLEKFRGRIRQTPPLYSAVKQGGVPLYRRVRSGEKPFLAEREVEIYKLTLRNFSFPTISLEVICSRGTYIRTLAADIGRALGCGAHLGELRRLRSGKFTIDQALSIEEFKQLAKDGTISERIIPLAAGLDYAGKIIVADETARKVRQGRLIYFADLPAADFPWWPKGERILLFQGREKLLAIAQTLIDKEGEKLPINRPLLRIQRVFNV
ncbi:MAG: tRNA pseudouridine(55) synthase TruB [Thermodesulfobacteriota bacterium]